MGRPPCCDKIGVKKGPWTPEEDIILVSYIQEHGPGNWRSVPTNTGLLRCSKSCRLRWTNYLRPGIKRGNFSDHEEKMIIHLQALLGNRWAAIASYLAQRTDNDIKNYWNTHLKKKLKKLQTGGEEQQIPSSKTLSKGQWERRLQTDINTAKQALCEALSLDQKPFIDFSESKPFLPESKPFQTPAYASSTGNIAKLLENWKKNSPKPTKSVTTAGSCSNEASQSTVATPEQEPEPEPEHFDSLFNSDQSFSMEETANNPTPETRVFQDESKPIFDPNVPLSSLLEKWLYDDNLGSLAHADLSEMPLEDSISLF